MSSVSHELRTPLTTIKTFTRLLQRNNSDPAEREDYLETIAGECDRQIEFVQNLLDLSRIESGVYKTSTVKTNLAPVLENSVKTQQKGAEARKLDLRLKLPESALPPALTDETALRRIISGLLENAIKYSVEGGLISVAAEAGEKQILINVADTGCGIAEEDLLRIFEKFYRGRPLDLPRRAKPGRRDEGEPECLSFNETAGVGLGLYLVKSLVDQIGATITVQSPVGNSGRGTKFTICVPSAENWF